MWVGGDVAWEHAIILREDFYFSQLEFYVFGEDGMIVVVVEVHYVMEVLEAVGFVGYFAWHSIEQSDIILDMPLLGNRWGVMIYIWWDGLLIFMDWVGVGRVFIYRLFEEERNFSQDLKGYF